MQGVLTKEDPGSMDTLWASSNRKWPCAFREIFTRGQGEWRKYRLKIECGGLRAAGRGQTSSRQPLKTNWWQMYWTTTEPWRGGGGTSRGLGFPYLSKMADRKGQSSAEIPPLHEIFPSRDKFSRIRRHRNDLFRLKLDCLWFIRHIRSSLWLRFYLIACAFLHLSLESNNLCNAHWWLSG